MIKRLLAMLLLSILVAGAAESSVSHTMKPDINDQASLQTGMKLYVNYCMGCHSLQYQRYSRAAVDLGIPQDLLEENLIFSPDVAFNDAMQAAMHGGDAEGWLGAAPPDLTLNARLRGTDWIYSFLLGFYRDPERPTGVNNTVLDAVAMPNVLEPLQGVQELACAPINQPGKMQSDTLVNQTQSCAILQLAQPGAMSSAEFEEAVYDLTNFLTYVADPAKLKAHKVAPKVLIFIFIFGVIAYLLKREYWRDIH